MKLSRTTPSLNRRVTSLVFPLAIIMSIIGFFVVRNARGTLDVAHRPVEVSKNGWKRALIETKKAFGNKNISMLASGIAYGGTLAFFPLVVACVAIASTLISPDQIRHVTDTLTMYLPKDIASLLTSQLQTAMSKHSTNLIVAAAGIVIALFGVSGAMNSLVNAVNIMYECEDKRGIIKTRLVGIALTCFMVITLLVALPLILLGGELLASLGVPDVLITAFAVLRWPLLAPITMVGLAVVYRYAPDRENVRWQWVSWGALIATMLWLAATALFFIYIQYFANFSDSYSLFAGIIVLMTWLNYSGIVVLVGASINHNLEKQTILPTT